MTYGKQHIIAAGLSTLSLVVVVVVATQSSKNQIPIPEDSGLRSAAPTEVDLDEALGSSHVKYTNDSYNYQMSYPSNWKLDDSRESFPGDIIQDYSGRAFIAVKSQQDSTIKTNEGITRIALSIEEGLKHDPLFALDSFERTYWKRYPTFVAKGTRLIGNREWIIEEYTVLRPNHGGTLNISVQIQKDAENLYRDQVDELIHSVDVCPNPTHG